MKEDILSIASDLREGFISTDEAKEQLLKLIQSESNIDDVTCWKCSGNNCYNNKECIHCGRSL